MSTTAKAPISPSPKPLPYLPVRPKVPPGVTTEQEPGAAPARAAAPPLSNLLALHAAYGNGAVARALAPRPGALPAAPLASPKPATVPPAARPEPTPTPVPAPKPAPPPKSTPPATEKPVESRSVSPKSERPAPPSAESATEAKAAPFSAEKPTETEATQTPTATTAEEVGAKPGAAAGPGAEGRVAATRPPAGAAPGRERPMIAGRPAGGGERAEAALEGEGKKPAAGKPAGVAPRRPRPLPRSGRPQPLSSPPRRTYPCPRGRLRPRPWPSQQPQARPAQPRVRPRCQWPSRQLPARRPARPLRPGSLGRPRPAPPPIDTSSSEGLLQSLATVPASAFGQAVSQATAAAPEIQAREKTELQASFPEVERPTGLPRLAEKPEAAPTELEAGAPPEPEQPTPREGEPPETRHEEAVGPVPGAEVSTTAAEPADEEGGGWWDWLVNRVSSFVSSLPTSDPGLSTSAGQRPGVDLSGEADPSQNQRQQQVAGQEVAGRRLEADAATSADFGENAIYPTVPAETLRPSYTPTAAPARGGTGIGEIPAASGEVRAAFDQNAAPWLAEQVNTQLEQHRQARAEYEDQSQQTRDEGRRRIDEETQRARGEQEAIQQQARGDVDAQRERWREQNRRVEEQYATQCESRRAEIDQQIQEKVQTTEQKVETTLTDAEGRADQERVKAEAEAAARKREAEERPQSWWQRVKGAISSAFKAIKAAVNAVFDALRKVVKAIIEAAKAVVRDLIEMARMLIVGLIRTFGVFVKGLVTIALAAFPETAAKARAWIDDKVNTAVKAVNDAAEALKRATDAILDWVGGVLDTILGVFQKAFSVILDVLKFLAVGLLEAMKRIGYLVTAARGMPDQFWGQVSEEMLGMDLTQPLPFERTESPETRPAAAAAAEAGTLSPTDAALLSKAEFTEADLAVDEVSSMELEPDLVSSLDLGEGEEVEFGEQAHPSRTLRAIQEEMGGAPSTPEAGEAQAGPEAASVAATPDVDAELAALMAQEPAGCTKEKPGEAAKQGEIPENLKIGPLTKWQRAQYLASQMKKGIKNWFACNWPKLVAGLVGALLGIILLEIVTVGAITAALPLIMQIIGAIMIGVAIVRVSAYVGDYLTQGWASQIAAAAKSLARGLAIGAIELVFALLFNLGAVIKSMRAGLRASARAAARAVKATVRTTIRNVRELGRIGIQAAKATVRNGKLVLQGVKSGFAKGARSLDDLARRLWSHVRFRKFKLKRAGMRVQLWGYINPWILLCDGSIKWVEEDKLVRVGGRVPRPGEAATAITETGRIEGTIVRGTKELPDYRHIADIYAKEALSELNVIHHAIEQQARKKFPHLFAIEEIHAATNLRAILKGPFNSRVHLSRIRVLWNQFYPALAGLGKISEDAAKRAFKNYRGYVDEFIAAMKKFMEVNDEVIKASTKGDGDAVRRLLDTEAQRLLEGPLRPQERLENIIKEARKNG